MTSTVHLAIELEYRIVSVTFSGPEAKRLARFVGRPLAKLGLVAVPGADPGLYGLDTGRRTVSWVEDLRELLGDDDEAFGMAAHHAVTAAVEMVRRGPVDYAAGFLWDEGEK